MPELRLPTAEDVTDALRRARPDLGGESVTLLGEGWDFRAFAAGDFVARVPKVATVYGSGVGMPVVQKLQQEQRLYEALAPVLPVAIPEPEVYEDGPNGLAFAVYRRVPGVMLRDLKRPAAPGFGAALGRVLRALHSFPVAQAAELGLEVFDGARARQAGIDFYEGLVRNVFPLISCEARTYVRARCEAFLNDPANFSFEPRLYHADLDNRNALADPESGELSGLIDFGDCHTGDVAGDFTWPLLGGLESLGIGDEVPDFLREAGVREEAIRGRCEFYKFCWPLHEISHGLEINDEDFVRGGIEFLNSTLPRDLRCVDAS